MSIATGSVPVFGSSASGTQDESVGGITFTADATNGFFTVPTSGIYSIFIGVNPVASLGTTSAFFIVATDKNMEFPIQAGTGMQAASVSTYLGGSATIEFFIANNSGSSTTGTFVLIEITRLTMS